MNGHSIKAWSSTQGSVALSSGEAEFAGVVRGAGIGLGYISLLEDLGIKIPMRLWCDSSAAIGICSRQGLGKLRHLDTHTLWVQQAVRVMRFELRKVLGESNPADLMTKHSQTRDRLGKFVQLQGCSYQGGRAEKAALTRPGHGQAIRDARREQAMVAAEAFTVKDIAEDQTTTNGNLLDPIMPQPDSLG